MLHYKRTIVLLLLINVGCCAFAQLLNTELLEKNFNQYQATHYQEKIFAHTDKTFYVAGETIWFTAYCVDGMFFKPSPLSTIAYAELISNTNKTITRISIQLQKGIGGGYIKLPMDIDGGNYQLILYTNWMKNRDGAFFYHQQVQIINTINEVNEAIKTTQPLLSLSGYTINSTNFVAGIANKIGCTIKGLPKNTVAKGWLLNNNNDTISTVHFNQHGIASNTFTPQLQQQYKLVALVNNKKLTFPFANKVVAEGATIHIVEDGTSNLKIQATVTKNYQDATLFLVAQINNRLIQNEKFTPTNGNFTFRLDKTSLGNGVVAFALIDENKNVVGENFYYNKPVLQPALSINTNKLAYSIKDSVRFTVTTTSENIKQLSATVFLVDQFQPNNIVTLQQQMLLQQYCSNTIDSIDYYLSTAASAADIENMLLVHQPYAFPWKEMLTNKDSLTSYLPEINGHIYTIIIKDKNTLQPIKGKNLYAIIPGKLSRTLMGTSNEKGEVFFNMETFTGTADIIIMQESEPIDNVIITTESPKNIIVHNNVDSVQSSLLSTDEKKQLTRRSIHMQAVNAYLGNIEKRAFSFTNQDSIAFYEEGMVSYALKDYTQFATLEEVFHEYIKTIRIRKTGTKYNLRVKDLLLKQYMDFDPFVLLDGLPVTNINQLMEISPLKIEKIQVGAYKFAMGNNIYDGIISVHSYDGDLAGYALPNNAIVIPFNGVQAVKKLSGPEYTTAQQKNSPLPDFRNVLYFNTPLLGNNQTFSDVLYTSGFTGKYIILLQGIDENGLPVIATTNFTVQ